MKRKDLRRRTVALTVSAMLSALGVVLLALGSLLETIDLSVAALASFFVIYAVIELKGAYPWMMWIVTSGLAWLLLPQKSPALFYTLIGFYPILKEKAERLRPVLSWVIKLVCFHLFTALAYLGFRFLLTTPDLETRVWMLALLYLLALICFILYDIALSRIISFYFSKLRSRLGLK